MNFTNSKTLVDFATATRVTFDVPECKEPSNETKMENEKNASEKKQEKIN